MVEEKLLGKRAIDTELFNQSANMLFARIHSLQSG